MPDAPDGAKLDGMDYRVVKPVGTGAGSTIFLIVDSKLGSRYALKVVKRQEPADDVYVAQAQHEFEVARRLDHPNLLRILDARVKKAWFKVTSVELLMEYVDGRSLDAIECPELDQLVLIFIHVASALNHMHRRGISHGDLKPSNIMLSRRGEVKVLDFGTAWIKGQPKDRVQGTPQYMAPEQATEKVVDDRTDLYNFGATMYRLLTNEYANLGIPQLGDGGIGARGRPQPPLKLNPKVPGTLNEAVMACLEPSPDRRPAGVFEVKHQLVAVAKYLGLKPEDLKGSHEDCEDEDHHVPAVVHEPAPVQPQRGGETGFWNALGIGGSASDVRSKLPARRCGECGHLWAPRRVADAAQCPECGGERLSNA